MSKQTLLLLVLICFKVAVKAQDDIPVKVFYTFVTGEITTKKGGKDTTFFKTVGEEISKIKQPTLLIWGNNDIITPPFVGEEFKKLIPNSELHFIDKCGHAPMMEQAQDFNRILEEFLNKLNERSANPA